MSSSKKATPPVRDAAAKTETPQITILKRQPGLRDQMLSADLAERQAQQLQDLVAVAMGKLAENGVPGAAERARSALAAFLRLYDDRPVRDNKGGSGFNDSLWLFVMAAVLQPRFIVESGVFKGHSTWLLRQACPEAEIHCFDPLPEQRVHHDPRAIYYDSDWMAVELPRLPGDQSLVFLDDHVSHARRLIEAHGRGFRRFLLDDNFPADQLYATGWPPVPTLQMILDPALLDRSEIRWARNGKIYAHNLDHTLINSAKRLIEYSQCLPELAPVTRYSQGSGLSFVKLLD